MHIPDFLGDDDADEIDEGQQRNQRADDHRDIERVRAERGNARNESAYWASPPNRHVCATAAARLAMVEDLRLPKADPAHEPAQEGVVLLQPQQFDHHAARKQFIVARVHRDVGVGNEIDDVVGPSGDLHLDLGLAGAAEPRGVDHVGALAPFLDHLRNEFRRVLQIGVQADGGRTARVGKAGEDARRRTAAAARVDDLDSSIFHGERAQHAERTVVRAIVDEDHLVVVRFIRKDGRDSPRQFRNIRFFVAKRENDRN